MGRRKKRDEAPLSLFSFQDIMACLTGILILVSLLLAIDGLADEVQATPGQAADAEPADPEPLEELRARVGSLRRELEARRSRTAVSATDVSVAESRAARVAAESAEAELRARTVRDELERLERERKDAAEEAVRLRAELEAARSAAKEQAIRERVRFRPGPEDGKQPVFVEVAPAWLAVGELGPDRILRRVERIEGADAEARLGTVLAGRGPGVAFAVLVIHEQAIPRFEALRDRLARRGYQVGWQLWDSSAGGFFDGVPDAGGSP
jgi:hypothetical protein